MHCGHGIHLIRPFIGCHARERGQHSFRQLRVNARTRGFGDTGEDALESQRRKLDVLHQPQGPGQRIKSFLL